MILKENIGDAISKKREQAGLNQTELATKAGMKQGQISTLEKSGKGASKMYLATAVRVCSALGVDLNWLTK